MTTLQPHPVFSHFRPFCGKVPAFSQVDYMGTMIRQEFMATLAVHSEPVTIQAPGLAIDEEYFEWIDVLESVVAARGSYTMIDLGAGVGRWAVRAHHAARQYNPRLPRHLIAVEAEPTVFEWMRLHFEDNRIDPADHTLLHGAVTNQPGDVLFYVGGPRGGPFDLNPNEWYGQRLTKDYELSQQSFRDGEYAGRPVLVHKSGWRSVPVPSISLQGILEDLADVDLIDMDVEEQEFPVVQATIRELDAKVRRLHIGTHSTEGEADLRELLSNHDWHCLADYSQFSTSETPWGEIRFNNGVQSWINPRFA